MTKLGLFWITGGLLASAAATVVVTQLAQNSDGQSEPPSPEAVAAVREVAASLARAMPEQNAAEIAAQLQPTSPDSFPEFPEAKPGPLGDAKPTAPGGGTLAEARQLKGHTKEITRLMFLQDGKTLVSMSAAEIIVWDYASGQARTTIGRERTRGVELLENISGEVAGDSVGGSSSFQFLAAARDEKLLVAQEDFVKPGGTAESADALVRLRDLNSGSVTREFKLPKRQYQDSPYWSVHPMAISPDGDTLVYADFIEQNTLTLSVVFVRVGDGQVARQVSRHIGAIPLKAFLRYSPDGRLLALATVWTKRFGHEDIGVELAVCDADGQETWKQTIQDMDVSALGFAADSKTLAVALGKRQPSELRLVDAGNGATRQSTSMNDQGITAVASSPDGRWLAASTLDVRPDSTLEDLKNPKGQVRLFEMVPWRESKSVRCEEGIGAVAFSPDSTVLASGGTGKVVRLTPIRTPSADQPHGGNVAGSVSADIGNAYQQLAKLAAGRGDWQNAAAAYSSALRDQPQNADLHHDLGRALLDQGKTAEAAASLAQAVQLNPQSAAAQHDYGRALARQADWAQAESAFHAALQLDPQNGSYRGDLAGVLLKQDKLDEAADAAQAAVEQGLGGHPALQEVAASLTVRAESKAAEGNWSEASLAYERAAGLLVPSQPSADREAASPSLPTLRPAEANRTSFHVKRGEAATAAGDWKAAEDAYREASRLDPKQVPYRLALAEALRRQGRVPEAETAYREIVAVAPKDTESRKQLSSMLQEQGRTADAFQEARQAVEFGLAKSDLTPGLRRLVEKDRLVASDFGPTPPPSRSVSSDPPSGESIPDVRGLPAAAARKRLTAMGLSPEFVLGDPAPADGKALTVYAIEPEAGTPLSDTKRIEVKLYAPLGAVADPGYADQAVVPDVIGQSAADARRLIEAAGLKARFQLGEPAPPGKAAHQVYRVEPVPGQRVPRGSTLQVTICAPSDPEKPTTGGREDPDQSDTMRIPNVIGKPAADARKAFEELGLVPQFQLGERSLVPEQAGKVYATSPPSGTAVAQGTAVRLSLYSPPGQ